MFDIMEAIKRATAEGPWDDATVEQFIDLLGQWSRRGDQWSAA